jgi:hypothetical protein
VEFESLPDVDCQFPSVADEILTIGVRHLDTALVDKPTRITVAFPEALNSRCGDDAAIRTFADELVRYVCPTVHAGEEPDATARVHGRREEGQQRCRLYDEGRKASDVITLLDVLDDHGCLPFDVGRETLHFHSAGRRSSTRLSESLVSALDPLAGPAAPPYRWHELVSHRWIIASHPG